MNTPPILLIFGDLNIFCKVFDGPFLKNFTLVLHPCETLPPTIRPHAILQIIDAKTVSHPITDLPWFAWIQSDDHSLLLDAYQAGARAVFPRETPPQALAQTILRTLNELRPMHTRAQESIQRQYHRGDLIFFEEDTVLEVINGVLATTMIHQDGAEVLLGLSGPGQLLITHPADNCHIQILAHTDALVSISNWDTAQHQIDFSKKLRARLQQMEGWAAMQARPYLDQRILGIMGLLAVQFGVACDQGIMIDVRITHIQLANAVGATRSSITRVLGELRATDKLITIGKANNERFCLRESAPNSHY
jgi:CRP-like cAMP-binding protein